MLVSPGSLERFVRSVLTALGAGERAAATVAASLVDANLTGHDSHGVQKLPSYVRDIRLGRLSTVATPDVVADRRATARVDGNNTFGHVVAQFAADLAADKAVDGGVGIVVGTRCHHTGRLGRWVERVAARGLIGLMWGAEGHAPYVVVPHGGVTGALATNPFAAAVPRRVGPPVLVDYATSTVSIGKLQVARDAGATDVPPGWLLDAGGRPSTELGEFFDGGGALTPFGGHKGYGLGVIAELLAVGLSGADDIAADARASCFTLVAIDPGSFRPRDEFSRLVDLTDERLRAAGEGVMVPGDPESSARARRREGIDLPEPTWSALVAMADELRIDRP